MHPFDLKCEEFSDNRRNVTLKENRSEYRAENRNQKLITCLKIDGCVLDSSHGKKCDFLLLTFKLDEDTKAENKRHQIAPDHETESGRYSLDEAHFIELKGTDMKSGIVQLKETVEKVIPKLKSKGINKAFAKLVLSKTPKIRPAKEWRALRNQMKSHNGDAFSQNSPFEDLL